MNKEIEEKKKRYPSGVKVRLVEMKDKSAPKPDTEGTIIGVDALGSILVRWEDGSTLSLLEDLDRFELIDC